LYDKVFEYDCWTTAFADYIADSAQPGPSWSIETPFRSEFSRRAALVEIDALIAIMLGLSAEHLGLIFRAQFPVLRKYEHEMYFDALGRRIAKEHHAHGVQQQKDDYKLLAAYHAGDSYGDLLARYTPFKPDVIHDRPWFYRPDRVREMTTAYSDFEQRLASK
jgi:hypothetical protein